MKFQRFLFHGKNIKIILQISILRLLSKRFGISVIEWAKEEQVIPLPTT